MIRFTLRRLEAKAQPHVSPYGVLGISEDTPFEEVRQCYYRLTQQYHPDMPQGDPVKFREINTAYRQIRAEYRKANVSGGRTTEGAKKRKPNPQSGAEFWEERNRRVREQFDRANAYRAQQEAEERTVVKPKRSFLGSVLYLFNGYEIVLSLFTVVVVLVCSLERYYTVVKMVGERRERVRKMDEDLPPMMPMKVNDEMKQRYSDPPDTEALKKDAERIRDESYYRRATQRRFEDFREFMFVYDPEGIADRKVTTSRFSFQYMNEKEIPKRCPILREFNSDVKGQGYQFIEKDLERTIGETPWVAPDAAFAGALVAKGIGSVPLNSPNTAKWTFIEYTNKDEGGSKAAPVCLAAIRNNRFESTGMCQRVTVTGKSSLQPQLLEKREKDLKSGTLNKKSLVKGKPLPIKDLSVPLQSMKL